MTCRELAEVLIDYVGGELPEEMCVTIRSHLEGCEECVHYIATYQVTMQISRRLPAVEPPASLLERLKAALEEK
jgi:anti-sigma factor RsiW